MRIWILAWMIAVALSGLGGPRAYAVIGVTLTMADLYERSHDLLVGEVAVADREGRVITLEVIERTKGERSAEMVSLVFPKEIEWPAAQPGHPAIVFAGRRGTAIHLADGWLAARTPAADESVWRVTRNDGPTTDFPGRTGALLRLLGDLKEGKRTIVNEIEHSVFKGEIRKLADISPRPRAVVSADVDGDGFEDVLVVGEAGSQLFLNRDGDLSETASDIGKSGGRWAAAGDIDGDGKPDFLVGGTIWINSTGGFKAGPQLEPLPEAEVLAAAIGDATGDGQPDVLLAVVTGEVLIFMNPGPRGGAWELKRVRLWNGGEPVIAAGFSKDWGDTGRPHLLAVRVSGPTRYALDPEGGPPADHVRLAGYPPSWAGPWEIFGGTVLDIDGNGLDDYYAAGPAFGVVFNSRGFGTFLSNYSVKRVYGPKGLEWGKLTRDTVLGSADLDGDGIDDLLVATSDGRLFEVDNRNVEAHY